MQTFINLPLRSLSLSHFKYLSVIWKSLKPFTFKRCLQGDEGPHLEMHQVPSWMKPPSPLGGWGWIAPPQTPSAGMWTRTHWSTAQASVGPPGQAGDSSPSSQGHWVLGMAEMQWLKAAGAGWISCWPLRTGTEFTHLKLTQLFPCSPCSPQDCTASMLLTRCSCAKVQAV